MTRFFQYKTRLGKQEARSFHRPALQIPANIEIRFTKVRSAKKKKDKAGRRLGRGGNVGENLRRTGDLSLRDTSNFVLWEYSVSVIYNLCYVRYIPGNRKSTHLL
jgi:transcription initiation factor TFIID subunit 1, fungi type